MALYELGFADRVISQELSTIIGIVPIGRGDQILLIRRRERQIRDILSNYPSYFVDKLDSLLQE